MTAWSWRDLYQGDLQSVYALWLIPIGFLVYWILGRAGAGRSVEPRATEFMNAYAPLFAMETILDPWATGPLLRGLALEEPWPTVVMVGFVLLGDFRIYLPIFYVLAPERGLGAAIARAAAWTLVVPIVAFGVTRGLAAYDPYTRFPDQTIWIAYEIAFVFAMTWVRVRILPSAAELKRFEVQQYLHSLARFVTLYYALWAAADLVIVVGGYDFGWGIRMIPNQLYYSIWIPFAYGSFFSARYAAESRPTHRAR